MIPVLSPRTLRAIRSTRLVISDAARRENVISRILGVRALDDQVGNAMGEGVGLAGPRSGNDEQWCRGQSSGGAMLDRTPLFGIEGFEVSGCCLHRGCPSMVGRIDGR